MANYIEYLQIGAGGEAFPVRDIEAHEMIESLRGTIAGEAPAEDEWLNPPMELGVEYKTMKRYLGKPVYVVAVSLGNLPNNSTKQVYYTHTGVSTNILDVRACAMNESGRPQPIPLDYNGLKIEIHANAEYVFVRTIEDNSAWTAVAIVEYTRD